MIQCPKCGIRIESEEEAEYVFCPECGTELPKPEAASSAVAAEEPFREIDAAERDLLRHDEKDAKRLEKLEALQNKPEEVISQTAMPLNDEASESASPKPIPDAVESVDVGNSDCPLLKVEYNRKEIMSKNLQGTIHLRLLPLNEDLENIVLFMLVMQGETRIQQQIPVDTALTIGRRVKLNIPFCPKNAGMLNFSFRIGCKTAEAMEYYQFDVEIPVFDPTIDEPRNGNRIELHTHNSYNLDVDRAAELTFNNGAWRDLREIAAETGCSASSIIQKMQELPPDFVSASLARTHWSPIANIVTGELYITDKLVLEWNDFRIYLLNKKSVVFGRSEEHADLVVHVGGAALSNREPPNITVSRKHAEVLYCDDTVKLFDRSSHGTYINGRKPDSAGMPIPDHALMEFGDIHWQMELQHCFGKSGQFICQACRGRNIKSMTFTRPDGEKSIYLLIWQCCELGRVNSLLSGWTVFTRNNSFFIKTPENEFVALRPGTSIEAAKQIIKVTYFNSQY